MNQSIIPTKNRISIGIDNAFAFFVFQVLYTCGKNAEVVNTAATKPMVSTESIEISKRVMVNGIYFN